MAPLTHLLASWTIGAHGTDNQRDCRLVALAGILPDLDGLGLLADLVTKSLGLRPTEFYARYHHYLLHGIFGALLIAIVLALLSRSRWRVFLLALLVVHVHVLCDFLGSRGPEPHDLWPIHYFGPFDHSPMWLWKAQWRLDGWQNRMITLGLFAWALWFPIRHGHSVVGVFNQRADQTVVQVLRKWHQQLKARWDQVA